MGTITTSIKMITTAITRKMFSKMTMTAYPPRINEITKTTASLGARSHIANMMVLRRRRRRRRMRSGRRKLRKILAKKTSAVEILKSEYVSITTRHNVGEKSVRL